MPENAVIKNSEEEGGGDKESKEIESPLLCAWMEYNGWDVAQWEGLWVILPYNEWTNSLKVSSTYYCETHIWKHWNQTIIPYN